MREAIITMTDSVHATPIREHPTGQAFLEEGNTWHDTTWGNCTCGRQSCTAPGANILRRMLMRLWDNQL
ncbi:hypothetical protein ACQPYK_22785 [Streptosporangium sp. CA-135522]|uniref:hypothetical protein n=1 Tax=Streptosporangium sp. CA-135522 TaxID=3240072 RepID=UPI003D8A7379